MDPSGNPPFEEGTARVIPDSGEPTRWAPGFHIQVEPTFCQCTFLNRISAPPSSPPAAGIQTVARVAFPLETLFQLVKQTAEMLAEVAPQYPSGGEELRAWLRAHRFLEEAAGEGEEEL